MGRANGSAPWRWAYEEALADASKLPILVRLTPATLFYVVYKQLRYLSAASKRRKS
jgi:hypothetical protein